MTRKELEVKAFDLVLAITSEWDDLKRKAPSFGQCHSCRLDMASWLADEIEKIVEAKA